MLTIAAIATDALLDVAYAWLCQQRKDWPADANVWRFRQHWLDEKALLRVELLAGTYQVELLRRVTLSNGEEVDLWSARDAVVMKALARACLNIYRSKSNVRISKVTGALNMRYGKSWSICLPIALS